jgi:biuret amidohydrolase
MSANFVKANPYPWPYNGRLEASNTALIVIDMQTDFCGKGGYVDKMRYTLQHSSQRKIRNCQNA